MRWVLFAVTVASLAGGQPPGGSATPDPVLYQGDIVVAPSRAAVEGKGRSALAINPEAPYRWPDAVVPYVVDDNLGVRALVAEAMAHWSANTAVRFAARTGESNYLHFRQYGTVCSSMVGMQGGEQFVNLNDTCSRANVIHEIGHALGLFHEQSREDRDSFVRIHPENLVRRFLVDFAPPWSNGMDTGPFDFGSIMLYGREAGSRAPQAFSEESKPAGIPMGEASGVSAGDAAAVSQWYGRSLGRTVIQTVPAGLRVSVDGTAYTAPVQADWAPGSTHVLEVEELQKDGDPARYRFARWSDGGGRSRTVTAGDAPGIFTAAFVREFRLLADVDPPADGTVKVEPAAADGYYTDGAAVTITATPADGRRFFNWSGTPIPVVVGGIHGLGQNPAQFRVTAPSLHYTAWFSRIAVHTVTADPPVVRVTVDGATVMSPRNFEWPAGSSHTIGIAAASSTGAGDCRWVFRDWSDRGERTHTVTAPAESATFSVRVTQQCPVYTAVEPGPSAGGITLAPASPDGYYDSGAEVQVTATTAGANRLANWTGDLSGTGETRTLKVSTDMLVQANFAASGFIPYSGVVNAASLQPGPVSEGETLAIFGVDAPGAVTAAFDELAADVQSPASGPLLVTVPPGAAGRPSTRLQFRYGAFAPTVVLTVIDAAPGVYTLDGSGNGAAAEPAARGEVVTLRATGLGAAEAALPIAAEIDGTAAEVVAADRASGSVQVRVPEGARSGSVPLWLFVNSRPSQPGVTLTVR